MANPSALHDDVEGLVVARVGDFSLAFPAANVLKISDWAVGDSAVPHARAAFGLEAINGRLVEEAGGGLVVDSLEIATERVRLLPVPPMLLRELGGALQGFIELAGSLCPVLSVAEFARYLSTEASK